MNLVEKTYDFTSGLTSRGSTTTVFFHHSVTPLDWNADKIHALHKSKSVGYSGIGYHLVILPDGTVERGRPEHTIGAHVLGHNGYSIGVCLIGNFETGHPTAEQIIASNEVMAYLEGKYGKLYAKRHSDVMATACPGRNFPMDQITGASSGGSVTVTTSNDQPMLQYGSKGSAVSALQSKLNNLGYNCGAVDGDFGSKTQAAVQAFQNSRGLKADGIVGPLTWGALNGVTVPVAASTYPGVIKRGQSNGNVRRLQEILKAENCLVGGLVDGVFGAKTEASVKSYQKYYGLAVDGVVGPDTWNHMNNRHGF